MCEGKHEQIQYSYNLFILLKQNEYKSSQK
jgi:hypothetical protein